MDYGRAYYLAANKASTSLLEIANRTQQSAAELERGVGSIYQVAWDTGLTVEEVRELGE